MTSPWRRGVQWIALLAALMVFAGFATPVHRAADSLALLRPVAGLVCLLALPFLRGWRPVLVTVAAMGAAAATVLPPVLPGRPEGEIAVYTKNVWFGNTRYDGLVADIQRTDPDVVLLQEISRNNEAMLDSLSEGWPHQHRCRFSGYIGIAIASRYPITESPRCSRVRAYALARVAFPQGDAWVASVHMPWPWPMNSAQAEQEVVRDFANLDAPVIIGGDFNSFPWTRRVAGLARLTGTRLAGPSLFTLRVEGMPLPIDHVLAPGGGTQEIRRLLGGDHKGVLARVHLTRQ